MLSGAILVVFIVLVVLPIIPAHEDLSGQEALAVLLLRVLGLRLVFSSDRCFLMYGWLVGGHFLVALRVGWILFFWLWRGGMDGARDDVFIERGEGAGEDNPEEQEKHRNSFPGNKEKEESRDREESKPEVQASSL